MATNSVQVACIGDIITLDSGNGEFLSVDICGNIIWDPVPEGLVVPMNFQNCLWKVCPKLSYTDQEAYGMTRSLSIRSVSSQKIGKESDNAKSNAEAEKYRNDVELAKPSGKPAIYGAIIQLQHVATGKFLTARNTAARIDRSCLGLYLDKGATAAYFHIDPRYKVRSEGGAIIENDVIVLASNSSHGYFVHESKVKNKHHTSAFHYHEGNLSRKYEECGLTIKIYMSNKLIPPSKLSKIEAGPQYLQVNQCVRFFDKENDGFITVYKDDTPSVVATTAVTTESIPEHGKAKGKAAINLKVGDKPSSSSSGPASGSYFPILRGMKVGDSGEISKRDEGRRSFPFWGNSVWVVEASDASTRTAGGFVQWETVSYRLRHISTGLYLTCGAKEYTEGKESPRKPEDNSASAAPLLSKKTVSFLKNEDFDVDESFLTLSLEPDALADPVMLARQKFHYSVVDFNRPFVPRDNVFVALVYTNSLGKNYYLHVCDMSTLSDALGKTAAWKTADASLLESKAFVMSSTFHSYDAVLLVKVSSVQRKIVNFIRNLVPLLTAFLKRIENPENDGFPKKKQDLFFENSLLSRIICESSGIDMDSLDEDDITQFGTLSDHILGNLSSATPNEMFQECAREQKLLELMFQILAAPMNAGLSMTQVPNENPLKKNEMTWIDSKFSVLANTHTLAWTTLGQLVTANYESSMHITNIKLPYITMQLRKAGNETPVSTGAITIIIEQVPFPVGAATFLNSIINDCEDLLVKRLNVQFLISHFKELIKDFGPKAEFISFFKSICSARGKPLLHNQSTVMKELVTEVPDEDSDILFHLYTLPGHTYERQFRVEKRDTDIFTDDRYLGKSEVELPSKVNIDGLQKLQLPRVYVRYNGSDDWKEGDTALYFSPKALGLKLTEALDPVSGAVGHHLSIEELCWILDKDRLFEKVRGANAEFDSESEEGMQMLAQYFKAQIDLLSEVVLGRNYDAIFTLEKIFPFTMLIGIVAMKSLPYSIRGSFFRLLNRLWVDRYPHDHNCGRQALPDNVWVFSELENIPLDHHRALPMFEIHDNSTLLSHSDEFYNIRHPGKFQLLMQVIYKFLNEFPRMVIADIADNQCICEVMTLVASLTSYGFYCNAAMINGLLSRLLPLLDGRSDVFNDSDPDAAVTLRSMTPEKASVSVDKVIRYNNSPECNVVMRAKVAIVEAVKMIVKLREQFRLMRLLLVFKDCRATGKVDTVDNVREIFNPHNSMMNQLNFVNNPHVRIPFDGTLVDLLMYRNNDLFEIVMDLLQAESTPMRRLLSTSRDLLLLENDVLPEFTTLKGLEAAFSHLRREFECFYIWSGQRSPAAYDGSVYEQIWEILARLKNFLALNDSNLDLNTKQMLLYEMDCHGILLMCLGWDLKGEVITEDAEIAHVKNPKPAVLSESSRLSLDLFTAQPKSLRALVEASLTILCELVKDNNDIRKNFSKKYTKIISESRILFPNYVFTLLSIIFSGSSSLVQSTPPYLFEQFGMLLADDNNDNNMVALMFFYNQLVPEKSLDVGDIIPRNQNLVANGLYYVLQADKRSIFRLNNILNDDLFHHHVMGVSLLSHCCRLNGSVTAYVGNSALPSTTAIKRLCGLIPSLMFTIYNMSSVPELLRKCAGNLERPATNMGIDLPEGVTGTLDQHVYIINEYLRNLCWLSFESTAIDVTVLFHEGLMSVFQFLSELMALMMSDMENQVHYEAEQRGFLDGVVAFLAGYVSAVNSSKSVFRGRSLRAIYNTLTSLCETKRYASYNEAAAKICLDASMGEEAVDSFHVATADDDREERVVSEKVGPSLFSNRGFTGGNGKRLIQNHYAEYQAALQESDAVSTALSRESRSLLHVLLDARSLTDPMEKSYYETHIAKVEPEVPKKFALKKLKSLPNMNMSIGNKITPAVADEIESFEVRTNVVSWDDIIRRMVEYVNDQIECGGNHASTKTILYIFSCFLHEGREIDERKRQEKLGDSNAAMMTIAYEMVFGKVKDEDDGRLTEYDEKYNVLHSRQCLLNDASVTALIFNILVKYSSGSIFEAALELGTLLLADGNSQCQAEFQRLCQVSDPQGDFFGHMASVMKATRKWVVETQYNPMQKMPKKTSSKPEEPSQATNGDGKGTRTCLLVLTFLQQLCEGHNLVSQELLRDQSAYKRYTNNLLVEAMKLFETIASKSIVYRKISVKHAELLYGLLKFFTDSCQGPCPGNQTEIGTYDFFSTCNNILSVPIARVGKELKDKEKPAAPSQSPSSSNRGNRGGRRGSVVVIAPTVAPPPAPVPTNSDRALKSINNSLNLKYYLLMLISSVIENRTAVTGLNSEAGAKQDPVLKALISKIDISAYNLAYEEMHFFMYKLNVRSKHLEDKVAFGDQMNVEILTEGICSLLLIRKKVANCVALEEGKRIPPTLMNSILNSYPLCHKVFLKQLGTVEVFWNDRTEQVLFPLPEESPFLPGTTKEAFLNTCDLTSCDTRVKGLMKEKDNFLDEMEVLSRFSSPFQFILKNYYLVKRFLFLVALLLNFNVILSLSRGSKVLVDYYNSSNSTWIMLVLGLVIFLGYFAVALYWSSLVISLNYRKLTRERDAAREEALEKPRVDETEKKFDSPVAQFCGLFFGFIKSKYDARFAKKGDDQACLDDLAIVAEYDLKTSVHDVEENEIEDEKVAAVRPFFLLSAALIVGIVVHYCAIVEHSLPLNEYLYQYAVAFALIVVPTLLYGIQAFFTDATSDWTLFIRLIFTTAKDANFASHWSFVVLILFALYGYVFLYCVILLDFITLSVHASNTLKSVIIPWQPLVNVAMIFFIVIDIFGIFSFVRLNGAEPLDSQGLSGDDDSYVACNSAWTCLGVVFYGGLRNSDVSSVLPQIGPGEAPSGTINFTSRIFFDLFFFIVIGCLLFNMVTGIIVDTFSSLREEAEETERLRTEESFISGINEDLLDGVPGVTLEIINNEHHNMWNYVYYAIYLIRKDPSEYNGIESYVSKCISNGDGLWFPRKTCIEMERIAEKLALTNLKKTKEAESKAKSKIEENSLVTLLETRLKHLEDRVVELLTKKERQGTA